MRVKGALKEIAHFKSKSGIAFLAINGRQSYSGKKQKQAIVKCRILKIHQRNQQDYILVTPINQLKATKLSIGEGTLISRLEAGSAYINF